MPSGRLVGRLSDGSSISVAALRRLITLQDVVDMLPTGHLKLGGVAHYKYRPYLAGSRGEFASMARNPRLRHKAMPATESVGIAVLPIAAVLTFAFIVSDPPRPFNSLR